jgi:hypothetical protein
MDMGPRRATRGDTSTRARTRRAALERRRAAAQRVIEDPPLQAALVESTGRIAGGLEPPSITCALRRRRFIDRRVVEGDLQNRGWPRCLTRAASGARRRGGGGSLVPARRLGAVATGRRVSGGLLRLAARYVRGGRQNYPAVSALHGRARS